MIVCFFLTPDKNERGYINLLCFIVQAEMLKKQKDEVMIFHFGENTAVQIFYFCRSFTKFSLDSAWSLLHVFLMLGKEAGADDMLLLSNNPFMFFYLFL